MKHLDLNATLGELNKAPDNVIVGKFPKARKDQPKPDQQEVFFFGGRFRVHILDHEPPEGAA